jgi:hypothetical protein
MAVEHQVLWYGVPLALGTDPLVYIEDRLNAHRYIDGILRPVLLPLLNERAGVVFQQDNTRPHITQISRTFLQQAEVEILPWRTRSLDLNPIWDIMGLGLRCFPQQANSLEELPQHLQQALNEIPQEEIDPLIRGMSQRVRECRY